MFKMRANRSVVNFRKRSDRELLGLIYNRYFNKSGSFELKRLLMAFLLLGQDKLDASKVSSKVIK